MFYLSHFTCDITPPLGHPLCGGWYPAAIGISERLFAHGVILTPQDALPIVLCAIDWAELGNHEHLRWRAALASVTGTTVDRVALHCVHNHDAPWPDEEAQTLLDQSGKPDVIMYRAWSREIMRSVASAASGALKASRPVDKVRVGQAKVSGLASNRRPMGPDGKVVGVRWTRCADAALRALPEGDLDPWLRTISFWDGARKLAAMHYYTIHPTSYDGTGWVTTDFPGIAREKLIAEEGIPHLYFTGCAGNITAGKYNDGVADNRNLFAQKIYDAMRSSEASARTMIAPLPGWRTANTCLPVRADVTEGQLLERINGPHPKAASRAAMELAYRRRIGLPITISALHFGDGAALLHLPGEAFVEYQLYAQHCASEKWLGVAAYGDLGPGYICLERSFEEGGYEPIDAFCAPESEHLLKQAIRSVLA